MKLNPSLITLGPDGSLISGAILIKSYCHARFDGVDFLGPVRFVGCDLEMVRLYSDSEWMWIRSMEI